MKGTIPMKMLGPVLDALPLEITLTDADDKIIAWSEPKPKIFHREDEILGTDVRDCHPEKSQQRLEQLLADMKSGKLDSEVMIIDCTGPDGEPAKVRIEYLALRDTGGRYLGCLEICGHLTNL